MYLLDIVQGNQMEATLVMSEGMLDVCSGVILAGETGTVLAYRPEIARIVCLLELEHSILRESRAKSCCPSGEDTIEHVRSKQGANHQILSIANTHDIPRLVIRQKVSADFNSPPEVIFVFPASQSTDGIAIEVSSGHHLAALAAEFIIHASLNDAE